MGASPWFYFVPYNADFGRALNVLREREFKAGRYFPAEMTPRFPVNLAHVPGCKHASIEEAVEEADASGTASILDMERVAARPDFGAVCPLDPDELMDLYGTGEPTRQEVEDNDDLFDQLERGQGVCFAVYEDGKPKHIYFAGYSFD